MRHPRVERDVLTLIGCDKYRQVGQPHLSDLAIASQIVPGSGRSPPLGALLPRAIVIARPVRSLVALAAAFLLAAGGLLAASSAHAAERSAHPTVVAGEQCTIEGARLDWGFKESFRAYVSGTIARGSWSTADGATYETPSFSWHGGTGSTEADLTAGEVAFPGSITFTGHGGILNTTLSNPIIRFQGASAVMLIDVVGETRDGQPVAELGVEFAQFDLTAASTADEGGTPTLTAAPGVFTASGADAFGTYPAGDAVDPITVALPGAAECATVEAAPDADAGSDTETDAADESADDEVTTAPVQAGPDMTWLLWVGGGVVVAVIAGLAVYVVRARTRA